MLKETLCGIVLLCGAVLTASGAPRTVERIEAYEENGNNIVLLVLASTPLTEEATVSDADRKLILLADASTGRPLKLAAAIGSGNAITLTLAAGESVDLQQLLLIRFDRVPFGGLPENVVEITEFALIPKAPPGTTPQKSVLKAADGKTDALVYFDGEISHVRKGDVIGTYDLKLSYLTYASFLGRVNQHGPLFTLQGGDNPKADPDSMQIGWRLIMPVLIVKGRPKLFTGLLWEQTPQIESTRNFTYSNFVYSSILRLVSRSWTSTGGRRLYVRPYIGIDAGRNLATTVEAARNQTVLRPLAGGTLNVVLCKIGDVSVSISGEYVRRWPLYNEVLLATDSTGKLQVASVGSKPRDHAKTGVAFNFTKFASVSANYERGSLPPAFAFVDNKFTLSLVIKAKK